MFRLEVHVSLSISRGQEFITFSSNSNIRVLGRHFRVQFSPGFDPYRCRRVVCCNL